MTEADSPEPAPTEPAPTAQQHVDPPPPQNPFVPRYREPWVNPAKRTPAIIGGLAAAVVLLALGFLLGLGVGGGGHRHGFDRPMMRPDGMYEHGFIGYGPRGHAFGPRIGPGYPPRQYQEPGASTPPAPPQPSSSHS
jgi:hypothetical protein